VLRLGDDHQVFAGAVAFDEKGRDGFAERFIRVEQVQQVVHETCLVALPIGG
jgi:hypothetical protein